MIWNDLKFALRSLRRERFFSLLNICGLAVGLAAAVLLSLWVQDEWQYDRFHSRSERLFRVLTNWKFGEDRQWIANTPAPLADEARPALPEAQQILRIWMPGPQTLQHGVTRSQADKMMLVDENFFRAFDFTFLKGDARSALADPKNLVLTESLARSLFGELPDLGETVQITTKGDFRVSAILHDLPGNSSIQFNCLAPWTVNAPNFAFHPTRAFRWGQYSYSTWVLLKPGASPAQAAAKLSAAAARHREGEGGIYFALQNIRDIHLYSDFLRWGHYGSLETVRIVGFIALLILVIACINYVNLAAARATRQARNAGIRKTIGAARGHLFRQSMLESGLTVLAAVTGAALLLQAALPYFEDFSGKNFPPEQLASWQSLRIVAGAALLAWLLSGIQPALQFTRFRAVEAMRGTVLGREKTVLRKILVTTQFVCSIGLGICAIVVGQQLKFVRETNLGYDREQVFSFFFGGEKADLAFKQELEKSPAVRGVTLADNPFVQLGSQYGGDSWEGKNPGQPGEFWAINVDSDFPVFFDLKLHEGRWFREGHNDTASFILNESAVRMMQLKDPVGKWMEHGGTRGTIVGVARDFHFQSLHSVIQPLVFAQMPGSYYVAYVKTTGAGAAQAIAAAEAAFGRFFPEKLFSYEFVDDQYGSLYKAETRTGRLVGFFTGLALFISFLGVFGLAAYAAVRRAKEISVRKVLGATVASIIGLLSADFIKLVLIALLFASPVAWYLMQQWLNNFAYHIDLRWWMFAAAGAGTCGLALLVAGFQAGKAALTNPTKSLKEL